MIYKFFLFPEKEVFFDFVNEELSFTLKMIKKSFSNFSAWHYRSKLITLDLPHKKLNWSNENILNYFKEDLYYLKNAIFTDPRDQSPWNYHNWILGNVTPIILKSFNFNGFKFSLNFLNKIPFEKMVDFSLRKIKKNRDDNYNDNDLINLSNFNLLDFISDDSKTENISLSKYYNDNFNFDITEFVKNILHNLSLSNNENQEEDSFLYKIYLRKKSDDSNTNENKNDPLNQSQKNLKFNNDLIPLKNNLDFPEIVIIFDSNEIKEINFSYRNDKNEENNFAYLKTFLESQLEMLHELIKVTDEFIENAHFRKLQILMMQKYLEFNKDNKNLIENEINLLISKSKRMKEVYKNINYE
jgi:hypothetical protein